MRKPDKASLDHPDRCLPILCPDPCILASPLGVCTLIHAQLSIAIAQLDTIHKLGLLEVSAVGMELICLRL